MSATPFATILDAVGVERLREHMAGRRLLHVRAPAGLDRSRLISRDDLEALAASWEYPSEHFKIYAGYRSLDPAAFRMIADGRLKPGALAHVAGQPVTMVFNQLERFMPSLQPFAREAEAALRDPVHVGAILSLADKTGIDRHYDRQSLIIVQIEGAKTWRFYGDPVAGAARSYHPGRTLPPAKVTREIRLEPGDLLFVPAGQTHDCAPSGLSLHLGILIRHLSGAALAEALAREAAEDEALGEPLFGLLGPAADADGASRYRARLIALFDALDPGGLRRRRMADEGDGESGSED